MGKIVYMGGGELYQDEVANNLTIPKFFVEDDELRQRLYSIIYAFGSEEQKTILLHYWINFSVKEIAALTNMSPLHVACILFLYLEKLKRKLAKCNTPTKDIVHVEEFFKVELHKQYEAFLHEYEKDLEYKLGFIRTREALQNIFAQ